MSEPSFDTSGLGRLVPVDTRTIWQHEAYDFTPWLLANADALGEKLGMDLVLERAEHPVGGFSLDLIGEDEGTGERVIVENQLTISDHTHLGQILTYAGGTDPSNIVWVALGFRDEHRAALDWLNAHTDEETRFFAVQVSVVRIGDSAPAPLLDVVVQPNDWGKSVKASTGSSAKQELYRQFWGQFLDRVHALHSSWTNARTPYPTNWIDLPSGVGGVTFGAHFSKGGPGSYIYFGSPDTEVNKTRFAAALAKREAVEASYGGPLKWSEMPGRKACRISDSVPGVIEQTEEWDAYLDWFVDSQSRLRTAVKAVGGVAALIDGSGE